MCAVAPLLAIASVLVTQEFDTAGGSPFSVDAALARGPVVMIFWNSWLPESAASVPFVHELEDAAHTRGWAGAVVIFQDVSDDAPARLGAGTLARVLDRRGALLRRFQVTRAPAVLVIDRGGRVASRSPLDAEGVRAAIRAMGERPSAPR